MLPHFILITNISHIVLLIHLSQSALQAVILAKLKTRLSHTAYTKNKLMNILPFHLKKG